MFPIGLSASLALTFWSEQDRTPIRPLVVSGFCALGYLLTAAALLLGRDLLRLLWWLSMRLRQVRTSGDARQVKPNTRCWLHVSSWLLLVVAGVFLWFGQRGAERVPTVHRLTIPIRALPGAFTGYRIAQLTDVHLHGRSDRGRLQQLVAQVNALNVDLIALTGDVVDGPFDDLRSELAPLGELRARDGVYVAMGNHENYAGADACAEEFRRFGFRVLLNEHQVVAHGLDRIVIAGVTNPQRGMHGAKYTAVQGLIGTMRSNPVVAIAAAPQDTPRILLAHQPKSVADARGLGFDLALAGHTHGGQFLPWNFGVELVFPYAAGLYVDGPMQIYVSPGIGTFGPALRLGTRAEIAVLELRPAK